MKRIFAFVLALIICTVCFVGCKEEEKVTEKVADGKVKFYELNITFPEGFAEDELASDMLGRFVVTGPGYRITMYHTLHSTITPNPGYDFPTLYQFFPATRLLGENIVSAEDISTVDGIAFADSDTNNDGEPDRCDLLFDDSDAFWVLGVTSTEDDYETVRANAISWAKTVVFD